MQAGGTEARICAARAAGLVPAVAPGGQCAAAPRRGAAFGYNHLASDRHGATVLRDTACVMRSGAATPSTQLL